VRGVFETELPIIGALEFLELVLFIEPIKSKIDLGSNTGMLEKEHPGRKEALRPPERVR
jgi:hypothetical protein